MAKIKITQVKSTIDRSQRQKDTIKALGIQKVNRSVEKEATPQVLGMVAKVKHWATSAASSTVKKLKSTVAKMPTQKKIFKTDSNRQKTVINS